MKKKVHFRKLLALTGASVIVSVGLNAQPGYLPGDFHQHTTFTDGSFSVNHVFGKNVEYGLSWWANSEHGGGFNRDGRQSGIDLDTTVYWDASGVLIEGDSVASGGHQLMWRWQSLSQYSFPSILQQRKVYPQHTIFQGLEWNAPGHEHVSVCIIGDQFKRRNSNVDALSEFEYRFDASDRDTSGGAQYGWEKSVNDGHLKTLEAVAWCQENHPFSSWLVPAHPERKKRYTIADFRDMNNVGPTVCFGFESMPGHQKSSGRGGYSSSADGGLPYGGAGYYSAIVGGLWDAMLSEGRSWWLFANSDFHSEGGDFYPGEYQKTYVFTGGSKNPYAITDGLRSGNSWVVCGDLIDYMKFNVQNLFWDANMGDRLFLWNKNITIKVLVHDPQTNNNNTYSEYSNPVLDHIDLIAGEVHGLLSPTDSLYAIDTVATTKVIARFDANGGVQDSDGLVSSKWIDKGNGWKLIKLKIKNVDKNMYYRLRGTNQSIGVENETDGAGNPLSDQLMGTNNAEKAFQDLWFYSNPIFVYSKDSHEKRNRKGMLKSDTIAVDEDPTIEREAQIKVYPNPVTNILNVYTSSADALISIVNNAGAVVLQVSSYENYTQIDVSRLAKGEYYVTVEAGKTTESFTVIVE